MGRLSLWPAILGIALAMIVVVLIEPVANSMAYAAGAVVLIALLGWVTEARAVAGPPPAVEPEHEEEEEAPGPSYWPVVLALGIVGIAAGIVYDFKEGALVVAVPLALWSGGAWANAIKAEMMPEGGDAEFEAEPIVTSGGRVLMPVQPNMLATQAAGGAAIALERVQQKEISRRGLLRITFWSGLGAGLLAFAGTLVDFLYPRGITGFGSVVSAGPVAVPSRHEDPELCRPLLARQPDRGAGWFRFPCTLVEVPAPWLHGAVARQLLLRRPDDGREQAGLVPLPLPRFDIHGRRCSRVRSGTPLHGPHGTRRLRTATSA